MRFATGVGLLDFCIDMQKRSQLAAFPFVIVHDPKDQVVEYGPSKVLADKAPSRDKQLINMEGGLHDLIANETEVLKSKFAAWMLARSV